MVSSRPPRDAAWRGRRDPAPHGSVLGVEDATLPAGETPSVRSGRWRSGRGAPARSLGAGLTAGARAHAGTRSEKSPGRAGRSASFTNPEGRTAPLSRRLAAPFPLGRGLLPRLLIRRPPASQALASRQPSRCLRNRPASGGAALAQPSFTFPPPESCRSALLVPGRNAVAKRKCGTYRAPAPGRSACAGASGNAGVRACYWRATAEPTAAARAGGEKQRRTVAGLTMEGGGGSGNKTTGGLAGFFGAGGAGYSHADLAGVPRKYRASPASV